MRCEALRFSRSMPAGANDQTIGEDLLIVPEKKLFDAPLGSLPGPSLQITKLDLPLANLVVIAGYKKVIEAHSHNNQHEKYEEPPPTFTVCSYNCKISH